LDETSRQLIAETRAPIPPKPGRPARHDYEYQRNGVANLFMIFAPLEGWRRVQVTDPRRRRLREGPQRFIRRAFPRCRKNRVGPGQSEHAYAGLAVRRFPAPEARRLAKRFEWHSTPKHGSWLDMAESELAVLTTQCLSRRIPDWQILEKEVAGWESIETNATPKPIANSRPKNARVKLKRLYPQFE
jgi:hypothetical protein